MAMPLPSRYADVPDRAPESLYALHGPRDGVVSLPLHLCWSGSRRYDVAQPSQCLVMYQIVITEGERADVERFLAPRHLLSVWPKLRRLLGPAYRDVWEGRFPELRAAAEAAEPQLQDELRRAREAVRIGRPI
jgi:hypothetical protein